MNQSGIWVVAGATDYPARYKNHLKDRPLILCVGEQAVAGWRAQSSVLATWSEGESFALDVAGRYARRTCRLFPAVPVASIG